MTPFFALPLDLVSHVFQFLSLRDQGAMRCTCTSFKDLTMAGNSLIIPQKLEAAAFAIIHEKLKPSQASVKLSPLTTDEDLSHLRQLSITHLDLSTCRGISHWGLSHLRSLPLQHLNLGFYARKMGSEEWSVLESLPLQVLSIKPDAVSLPALSRLRDVRSWDIRLPNRCSDQDLAHVKKLPIESLFIPEGALITTSGLKALKQFPLKKLIIHIDHVIDNEGMQIIASFEHLEILHLWFEKSTTITDEGLTLLKSLAPSLKELILVLNPLISDTGLAFLKNATQLETLHLIAQNVLWSQQLHSII